MGSHYIPRRKNLPEVLGGGRIPKIISDSPFNVLKPKVNRGDMYERHYNVDPQYRGGKIPARFGGGGWSGKVLGWERYGPLGQAFYGAPAPLKAAIGASMASLGAFADHMLKPEKQK